MAYTCDLESESIRLLHVSISPIAVDCIAAAAHAADDHVEPGC